MIKITVITILSLQIFIISFLLLFKTKNKTANSLLALLLFFFGLTTLNFALFYGLFYEMLFEYIPYLRLEPLYGLGPALYLYTKSVTNSNYRLNSYSFFLFIPAIVEFFYYRTSLYRDGLIEVNNYSENGLQLIFKIQQWTGFIYSTVFMILSVYLLYKYKKWLFDNFSYAKNRSLQWIHTPIVFFVSFWLVWFVIRLADLFIFSGTYSQYYVYPMMVILSVITLWIGFQGYTKSKSEINGFDNSIFPYRKTVTEEDFDYMDIIATIRHKMENEKLYLNDDFNMNQLSLDTGIRANIISKAINKNLNMNFHEFVNKYRVNDFIERIKNDKSKEFTLLAHAFDSGFGSKSTFNHIFKKYTNKTPKDYYSEIYK